jgi:uncharacterized phiE125 gp8 family phage protein
MLTLVTAPTTIPLSLVEAKAAARIDGTEDDALIAGLIRSVVAQIDGRDGWLGRQLCTATWRWTLKGFAPCLRVPLPPTQQILDVSYIDSSGVEQTLDPSAYVIAGADPAAIVPAYGTSWPATRYQPDAVRIEFVAGYGGWNDIPEDIRHAIALMVTAAYDGCHCEAAERLLYRHRAW